MQTTNPSTGRPANSLNRFAGCAIELPARNMSISTGNPTLEMMSDGSTQIPVWLLSGSTNGQSVTGLVTGLPIGCAAVKIEIVVMTTDPATNPKNEDVYRVHLSHVAEAEGAFEARSYLGYPVRTALPPSPFQARTIVLESYYEMASNAPLWVRVQREPDDPADSFTSSTGLVMVKVTPLNALAKPHVVEEAMGYSSWPMVQAVTGKLICAYSRGAGHSINEGARAVYARSSTDNGKTWTKETLVANTPDRGDVAVGKGLDSTGAMLLWVRQVGVDRHHHLYRTTEGETFTLVAAPKLAVEPMQISDIFTVPTVGLMALWFAGDYDDEGPGHSWGTLTSKDDGATWTQNVIESGLDKRQWATELSAVYLGNGRILAIARSEVWDTSSERSQFQMESSDYGATWTRARTNIGDVCFSTPSLVLDPQTGMLSNYYYQRGSGGILRRRVVVPDIVFGNPLGWPDSEAVCTGSQSTFDAGNVNATTNGNSHCLAFYSGKISDTAVLLAAVPAPMR